MSAYKIFVWLPGKVTFRLTLRAIIEITPTIPNLSFFVFFVSFRSRSSVS